MNTIRMLISGVVLPIIGLYLLGCSINPKPHAPSAARAAQIWLAGGFQDAVNRVDFPPNCANQGDFQALLPSVRHTVANLWPCGRHRPPSKREAISAANGACTIRRLLCFFLCHGLGKTVAPDPMSLPEYAFAEFRRHRIHHAHILQTLFADQFEQMPPHRGYALRYR